MSNFPPGVAEARPKLWDRARITVVPFALAGALFAGTSSPANADTEKSADLCLKYTHIDPAQNNIDGVCLSIGAAEEAEQVFYKLGNLQTTHFYQSGPQEAAKLALENRFDGPARRDIESRVAKWRKTASVLGNKVVNNVDVLNIKLQRTANRAIAKTRQRWEVYNRDNQPLYNEPSHTVNETLCNVKGNIGWVVVSNSAQSNYNCNDLNH